MKYVQANPSTCINVRISSWALQLSSGTAVRVNLDHARP